MINWPYMIVAALIMVPLSLYSLPIVPRVNAKKGTAVEGFGEGLNTLSYRAMMIISFIMFFIQAVLYFARPINALPNPMDQLMRYVILAAPFVFPLIISIPAVKSKSRHVSFIFCAAFHFCAVFSSIAIGLQSQSFLMITFSTILCGFICPAQSYVIMPFVFLLWVGDIAIFTRHFGDFYAKLRIFNLVTNIGISFVIGGALGFLTYHLRKREHEARAGLEEERAKSDTLIRNILPDEIVAQLKETGEAKPMRYEDTTIMFADIVGFTAIAEHCDPSMLVGWLDSLFKKFDGIAEKHALEKLKTIGDCYMTVCGVPARTKDHAARSIKAAFEMLEAVRSFKSTEDWDSEHPFFKIRIGVHSGPVVAGIIGTKKYSYDIWGDNVNIAARIEAAGAPGRINISIDTSELLGGGFKLIPRGLIDVRNRGPIEMFWVEME